MRICLKCKVEKELNEFYFVKHKKCYRRECKSCWKNKTQQYFSDNKDKYKIWRSLNKEKTGEYHYKNKLKILTQQRKNYKIKYKSNLQFRLSKNLRRRIHHAVKNGYKSDSTLKLLGCSIEKVKTQIELQFKTGMTWENYGDWHIDHIKPCASFDLRNPDEQKVCFNHRNLQPLWATTKIAKQNGDFESIGNIEKGSGL